MQNDTPPPHLLASILAVTTRKGISLYQALLSAQNRSQLAQRELVRRLDALAPSERIDAAHIECQAWRDILEGIEHLLVREAAAEESSRASVPTDDDPVMAALRRIA